MANVAVICNQDYFHRPAMTKLKAMLEDI